MSGIMIMLVTPLRIVAVPRVNRRPIRPRRNIVKKLAGSSTIVRRKEFKKISPGR